MPSGEPAGADSIHAMTSRRPLVRLLHASDTHLHWEQKADAIWCIEALRQAADRQRAHAVIVAGDVFDTADQPDAFIGTVAEHLNRFRAPVVLLPGNHDIRYADREPDTLGALEALLHPRHHLISDPHGQTVELLDGAIHLWGRAMPEHTPANDPLAGLKTSADPGVWSVVVAHGEVVTHSARRSSPIDLDKHRAILEQVDYVALGHHDEPSLVDFAPSVVCYSGSASRTLGPQTVGLVLLSSTGVSVEVQRLPLSRGVAQSESRTENVE